MLTYFSNGDDAAAAGPGADGRQSGSPSIDENKVAELAEYHFSPVEFVNLAANDGTKLYAMMMKPPNFDPARKYPVLVLRVRRAASAGRCATLWGGVEALWLDLMAQKGFTYFRAG